MSTHLRIGLIGAGANTRSRHIPGLKAIEDVEIVAVCNRRPGSTAAAAREFGIAKTYEHWQDLVADESQLLDIVRRAVAANPKAVADFKRGKTKAADAIKGAVMRETKGLAKMETVQQLVMAELQKQE